MSHAVSDGQTPLGRNDLFPALAPELLSVAFDSAAIGLCMSCPEGRILAANPAFCAMLGYGPEQLTGMELASVMPPQDLGLYLDQVCPLLWGRETTRYFQQRFLDSSGRMVRAEVWVAAEGQADEHRRYLVLQAQAVTGPRASRAPDDGELRFRTLFESANDLIMIHQGDGTVVEANRSACDALGYPREQLVGMKVEQLHPAAARAAAPQQVEKLQRQGRVVYDTLYQRRDGATFPVEVSSRLLGQGDSPMVLVTARDVSSRRLAEDAQRLAAVGELAAGVAHDFNNLLTTMAAGAQLTERGLADVAQLVNIVKRSTERGAEITGNLLAFARTDEPNARLGYIEDMVENALAVAGRAIRDAEVKVARHYATQRRPTRFSEGPMEQVFVNLIVNACHAMAEGGELTVTTDYGGSNSRREHVAVTVADTGTGIPPEDLPRVFEPFFTTKGRAGKTGLPGTGLGLSATYGIVKTHGGTITVRSEVGVGTIFEVRLPLATEEEAPATAPALPEEAGAPVSLHGLRVLIADDETDLNEVLEGALTMCECGVTAVHDAEAAIAALRASDFDVVVTDLMMPGGGGKAVLDAARELPAQPKVVVITGRLERSIHDELMALGAARTLAKPFGISDLLRTIAEVC